MKVSLFLFFAAAAYSCLAGPITVASVTASSTCCLYNAQNLINGAGLSGGLHDNDFADMWLANALPPATVIFNLGGSYSLADVQIWNYDSTIDLTRSTQDLTVLVSNDGVTYTPYNSFALPEGTGNPIPATLLSLGGVTASYVELNLTSNYGSSGYIGLSAVQFDSASVPEPASGLLLAAGLGAFLWMRSRARSA